MTVSRFFGGSVRTAPKVALSLLLSILLFAGLVVAAYAGLFNVLETRFYQPSIVKTMETQLSAVGDALSAWHEANAKRFQSFVSDEAVKRSLLPNQSAQDIFDRANLAGALMAEMPGVTGVRIIDSGDTAPAGEADSGKRRIHFSTFKEDILKKEDFRIIYEYYGRTAGDIPAAELTVPSGEPSRVITDAENDRFLYCFPFYDAYSTLRGTAVFYVSARSAIQNLVSLNLIRLSDNLTLVSSPDRIVSGSVSGLPRLGTALLTGAILDRWGRKDLAVGRIVEGENSGWVLLSRDAGKYGFIGQVVEESVFTFSRAVRILFLAIGFFTLFLVIFLLFNLRQDGMVVIRSRIRKFQIHLLEELLEKSDDAQWDEISKSLAYRKHDINDDIKKGFGRRIAKKHGKEIDALLDKSWEEILSAIGRQGEKRSSITSTEEIRLMLEQVLQSNAISLNLTGLPTAGANAPASATKKGTPTPKAQKPAPSPTPTAGEPEALEEVEALEEAESLEEVESPDEVEALEEIESLDEVESVEDIDAVEELEEIEEADAVEEIEEAESVEELDELTEVESGETGTAPHFALRERGERPISGLSANAVSADISVSSDSESPEELEELEDLEELDETPHVHGISAETRTIAEEIAALAEESETPEQSTLITTDEEGFVAIDMDTDLGVSGITLEEMEIAEHGPAAAEVEYLDGEWEPALLDVATDEELTEFIEETVPDHILVYNFEEHPGFGSAPGADALTSDADDRSLIVGNLDFTSLDSIDTEDATEVDYIDSFLLGTHEATATYAEEPAMQWLEIVGEDEPQDLLELIEASDPDETGAIVSEDGLYLIASKNERTVTGSIDPEFKDLVDSVLQ